MHLILQSVNRIGCLIVEQVSTGLYHPLVIDHHILIVGFILGKVSARHLIHCLSHSSRVLARELCLQCIGALWTVRLDVAVSVDDCANHCA